MSKLWRKLVGSKDKRKKEEEIVEEAMDPDCDCGRGSLSENLQ